ncbi:MAG: hypothetical protein O2795_01955 [Acidobacteria bacterium]|nr:hypothetical protein [Acidobacteriota bacterium]
MALTRRAIIVAAGVLGYLGIAEIQFGCGGGSPIPHFDRADGPGQSEASFVGGQLGILRSSFRHDYLFWAYRGLSGVSFDEDERKALLAPEPSDRPQQLRAALESWNEAKRVFWTATRIGRPPLTFTSRRVPNSQWQAYRNCTEDALRMAAATLSERVTRFGSNGVEAREWLSAQDVVFSNCGNGEEIPPVADSALPPLIQADRAYQIASAHFYAGHFDEAARRFDTIAADRQSPWSEWGTYLATRAYLRKGTLSSGDGAFDPASLGEAERRLRSVIADPRLNDLHHTARELLNYCRLRTDPERLMDELAAALIESTGGEVGARWTEYDWLLDRGHGRQSDADLTLWLLAFRSGSGNFEQTLSQWRAKRTLPWLVAALDQVPPTHEASRELIEAANRVPRESPGYPMATYHRLRLELAAGSSEAVRRELDQQLFDDPLEMPVSARNRYLEMRSPLARDLVL